MEELREKIKGILKAKAHPSLSQEIYLDMKIDHILALIPTPDGEFGNMVHNNSAQELAKNKLARNHLDNVKTTLGGLREKIAECIPIGNKDNPVRLVVADKILAVIPTPGSNQWVRVETEYPEEFKEVLVVRSGDKKSWHIATMYLREHLEWSEPYYVSHWQPLPQPPKSE